MSHDLLAQFRFLSLANKLVNESLVDTLLANRDVLTKPLAGFFPNISTILAHLYVADMLWTADIAVSLEAPIASSISIEELPRYESFRIDRLHDFLEQRVAADRQLIALVEGLRQGDLEKTVSDYDAPRGSAGHPAWKALQHVFNHQTHHRGQISLSLELFGVEHSYSDLIRLEIG